MDPEAKKSHNKDESDDEYETNIRNIHTKEEHFEERDENIEHRGNSWRYNLATNEAYHKFSTLFKELVMKYQRPVKKKEARRPLESKLLMKLILNELNALNLMRNKPVEDDPDMFIVYLYDSDKAKAEMNKCAAMSKAEKLQKQNEIEKLEDSITHLHGSRTLRDYKIDDLDLESAKQREELPLSLDSQGFFAQGSDKVQSFKTGIQSLTDDEAKRFEFILRKIVFGRAPDLENITTLQTPTQKEHKELDTTTAQISITPPVSGVERGASDVELSEPLTSESPVSKFSKSTSASPSKKSICKKLPASKSSPSFSTSVGSSQAKPKTPKYGHIQSTIPKSTGATKRPTSTTKKPTSATKKPK